MRKYILGAIWLVVAIAAGMAAMAGGDTAVAGGWFFLLWTLPFGVLWLQYGDDIARSLMPDAIVSPFGIVLVIALGFCLWFVLLPRVLAWARRGR
ncbi:MAG: hypothetical protein ABI885_24645 [Gammaproteobacteria bacterium]